MSMKMIWNGLCNGGRIMINSSLLLHFLLNNFWVFQDLILKLERFLMLLTYWQVCSMSIGSAKLEQVGDDLEKLTKSC